MSEGWRALPGERRTAPRPSPPKRRLLVELRRRLGGVRQLIQFSSQGSNLELAVEVSDGKLSAEAAVSVTVASVNDAPNALSAALALDEDTRLEGMLGARDADADPLTWKLVKKPRHGALELNPATGAFTYQPAPDFHGSDGFTFEVSDGHLKSQVAAVSLEVRPVNDAPVTAPLAISTREDVAAQALVAASDIDGDLLTWKLSSAPSHGQATINPRTGALSYRPAPDYNGADALVIEVSDGTASASSPVSVAISPVYDPPVVRPETFETQEDTPAEGKLPGSDPDGTALTFHLLSAPRLELQRRCHRTRHEPVARERFEVASDTDGEPSRVLEEVADRDAAFVGGNGGKELPERVVECELALARQLENCDFREVLGVRADLHDRAR